MVEVKTANIAPPAAAKPPAVTTVNTAQATIIAAPATHCQLFANQFPTPFQKLSQL